MILERRGDCSLILARVYGVERQKRRREEEEGKRKKRRRRNPGMEIWNSCLEHLFCLELLDLLVRKPP